jgi:hypothetical protein
MTDSIVCEHHLIDSDVKFNYSLNYYLIKYNLNIISVKTSYTGTDTLEPNIITIKNEDTNEIICQFPLDSDCEHRPSAHLKVFMYLDTILWIGIDGNKYHNVWLVDLVNLTWERKLSKFPIKAIRLVGQKCFYIRPEINLPDPCKVFPWTYLTQLDNSYEPVYEFSQGSGLVYLNWSSSSISYLTNCVYSRLYVNSTCIDLLDENFFKIINLNIQDLFPNYQPLKSNLFDQSDNKLDTHIEVNNNILLYYEYIEPVYTYPEKTLVKLGQTNIYCWDFTYNTQVNFPNYKTELFTCLVKPYRTSNNKVAYYAIEYFEFNSRRKKYESV